MNPLPLPLSGVKPNRRWFRAISLGGTSVFEGAARGIGACSSLDLVRLGGRSSRAPPPKHHVHVTKMLWGDTAYPIHAALVYPAPGGTLSQEERRYQLLLSEVRTAVEK